MSGRTRIAIDGDRLAARVARSFGADVGRLREDAGVSRATLARLAGIDPSMESRIETGDRQASLATMSRLGAALGCDLLLQLRPGAGLPLHDRYQAPMVEALIRERGPRWTPHPEVSVWSPARGSIDLVLEARQERLLVATEFQSQLRRLEQVLRWSAEKAAGLALTALAREVTAEPAGPTISRLLVLRSTPATRVVVRELRATIAAAYPAPPETVLPALRGSAPWRGSSLLWMEVRGREAHLLDGSPRGVR